MTRDLPILTLLALAVATITQPAWAAILEIL